MSQSSITNALLNFTSNASSSITTSHTVNNRISTDTFSKKLSDAKQTVNNMDTRNTNQKDKYEVQTKNTSINKVASTNKKEDNKSNRKISKEQSQVNQAKNDANDIEENDTKSVIDEQILMMMSQALQLPIEEIKAQLSSMGLEVQDLLSEDGFSQFINQVLAQGDVEALLSGQVDIKKISTLFNKLSEFKEQWAEIIEEHAIQDSSNVQIDITKHDQGIIQAQPEAEHLQTTEIAQDVTIEEMVADQPVENRYSNQEEENDLGLSFVESMGQQESDLGITVPIHHFTTTTSTQTFETDAGTVTQTTITKQAINGKAFIEQVDFKVLSQTKELNVSLSPKELGNMNIKIVENNGVMVAEIKVDNEKAKAFILSEISELKNSLEEQGLNVTDVKVDIRQDNHQTQMEQERQKSSKRIQEIIGKHLEEDQLEELEEIERPILSDSEVDYMV